MANKVVASARFNRLQWRLIFAVFVVAALLGFFGEIIETSWPGPALSGPWLLELSNDLFVTLLYFTFSAPVDASGANPALHVARVLAPLATVSAIIKIVIEAAYASWLQAQLKSQHGHIVVVGFGALGQQIARQFLQEGRKVVVLERQPTSDASDLAAQLGIPLVVGDAARSEDLAEVAVPRADSIFFVTDNDIVNLEACAAASALMSKTDKARTHLLVHLGDAQLSRQLQDYERRIAFIGDKRTAVSFFNLNDLLARQLLMENPLHRTAHWLCQDRLHVLIIGLNDISQKIIFHTLLTQRTHKLGPPHFTIIDPAASEGRAAFTAAYPGMDDVATFDFVDTALEPSAMETLIRGASKTLPLTATVLCLADEIENLTAALKIHAACAHGQIHAGNIMVRRDQTSDFFERLSRIERFDLANMLFDFGEGDHQLFVRQITGEDDILARRIHEDYCKQRAAAGDPPSPSTGPWDVLPESIRRANRRAADFLWTKLTAVGYRIEKRSRALPSLLDKGARLEEPAIISQLARLEHDRWWADRVVDGWQIGPERNNEALVHPDLRPFDALDPETRSKDEEQNTLMTELLKTSVADKMTPTPIERTIGLEFTTQAAARTAALTPSDCAADLKARFPDEAFLVLCEAQTPEEETWARALVAALGTEAGAADFIRLFNAEADEMLETLDADDQTLWLNLRATGAQTRDSYPTGLSRSAFLDLRADHRITASIAP
jgi:hypothetical protein